MSEEIAVVPPLAPLREYLVKKHDGAVEFLRKIQTIENDQQYSDAEQTLVVIKQLYEKMSAKRKEFTDPIKMAIEAIMVYENALNPSAKTQNEYTRARAVLDAYNQKKLQAAKLKEYEAEQAAKLIKYKAEYRANIQRQLSDMISGMERNLIDKMTNWEEGITLENFETSEKSLQNSSPSLKQEKYDACFRSWGQDLMLMPKALEDEFLVEMKAELTYAIYNEKYQQIAAPIKNEYLAKMPMIRERLTKQAEADEATRKKLKEEADKKLDEAKQAALKASEAKQAQEAVAIKDELEVNKYEGDFTQQMMTSDLDTGPTKKVASFADKNWLAPLLKVISKCATHPKFKGIVNTKSEYVPEVKKWLDFYGQYIGEPIEGLKFDEVAKTIVRKSKEE